MTLVNPTNKQMCTCIAWNPELPTQIITSSEDDNDPSLLVWDVRNARYSLYLFFHFFVKFNFFFFFFFL